MHERSLAINLMEQVARLRQEACMGQLASVEVEVGPLSGVEPALFRLAFHELVRERWNHDVELMIREVPLVLVCETCRQQTLREEIDFHCDHCGSVAVRVIRGDAIILVSVEFTTKEAALVPSE